MSTAVIALTRNGAEMARALAKELAASGLAVSGEITLLLEEHFVRDEDGRDEDGRDGDWRDGDAAVSFPLPARPVVQQAFREHTGLVLFLSAGELNSMFAAPAATATEKSPTPSASAHSLAGVWGVSEPSALLESGAERLLVERRNTSLATIAVERRPFAPPFDQECAGGQT